MSSALIWLQPSSCLPLAAERQSSRSDRRLALSLVGSERIAPPFSRAKALLLLDRSGTCLDRAQAFQVKLGTAIKRVDAVLLLVDIGQLRIAVAEHAGMIEQHRAQSFKALIKLLEGLGSRAVAPATRSVAGKAFGVPPDPAEFADHVGLMVVGERDRATLMMVNKGLPLCRRRVGSGKDRRVLLIIVAIIDIRFWHAVTVARSVQHRARLVEGFGGQKHRAGHIVEHGNMVGERLPGFV